MKRRQQGRIVLSRENIGDFRTSDLGQSGTKL